MTETTARLGLPLLQPGQAQKEMFHNEALSAIDIMICPAVRSGAMNAPPSAPAPGQGWIVGPVPTGAWTGHGGQLACWTAGGWRFTKPLAGMQAWVVDSARWIWHDGTDWRTGPLPTGGIAVDGLQIVGARRAAIAAPAGGPVIDGEARTAILAILSAMRGHGLIDT